MAISYRILIMVLVMWVNLFSFLLWFSASKSNADYGWHW